MSDAQALADTENLGRERGGPARDGRDGPKDRRPTFGSLFAGIGGIDLGLERAGWECRFQVEWDEFCQRVLARHWPDVPRYGDIHDVHGPGAHRDTDSPDGSTIVGVREGQGADTSGDRLRCGDCLPRVDLLAGGFPCQPFSVAGKQRRLDDDRWLWPEFARAIRELRPRYVLVENVPGLLVGGGMDAVLGDLATLWYDAEWESIPAAAVGAPHLRYRVWIVAYANSERGRSRPAGCQDAADAWQPSRREGIGYWDVEPDVGRVAHGVPARVDRLRSLGNAVVPQVVEVLGRAMMADWSR